MVIGGLNSSGAKVKGRERKGWRGASRVDTARIPPAYTMEAPLHLTTNKGTKYGAVYRINTEWWLYDSTGAMSWGDTR